VFDWKQSETHVQIENNDNLIVKKTLDRWVWDHSITKAVTITDGKLTLTFLNDDTVITGLWAILSNFENIAFYDGSTTEGLFLGGTDDALSEENVKREYFWPLYGPFHGMYGNTIDVKTVTTTKHELLKITARIFAFDHWFGTGSLNTDVRNDFKIFLDNKLIYTKKRINRNCYQGTWNYDPRDLPNPYQETNPKHNYRRDKCYTDVHVVVKHTSSNINLQLFTGLSRDFSYHSWGFMNLSLAVLPLQRIPSQAIQLSLNS
jgi:hypothetical protein